MAARDSRSRSSEARWALAPPVWPVAARATRPAPASGPAAKLAIGSAPERATQPIKSDTLAFAFKAILLLRMFPRAAALRQCCAAFRDEPIGELAVPPRCSRSIDHSAAPVGSSADRLIPRRVRG